MITTVGKSLILRAFPTRFPHTAILLVLSQRDYLNFTLRFEAQALALRQQFLQCCIYVAPLLDSLDTICLKLKL